MTTLMPEKPGHWTEAVLLAFPDASLSQEPDQPLSVTLVLEDDLEVEFAPVPFDPEEHLAAVLQEYDSWGTLQDETVLYEAHDIETLLGEMVPWVETYLGASLAIETLVAEFGVTEEPTP